MLVKGHLVKTIVETHQHLIAGSFTATDLLNKVIQNGKDLEHLNAFVSKQKTEILEKEAHASDERYKARKSTGVLDGIPITIKDNIFVKGLQASAASKALEGFIASMHAKTTERLVNENCIVLGTANMDEFGMGSYGQ